MLRYVLSLPLILISVLNSAVLAAPSLETLKSGLTFASQDELRGVPLAATPFSGATLPKKVDLSANMPPPGNQGNQNSCVGWSTAYALKSYQEKIEEKRNYLPNGKMDPKTVFSPAFIYNQINNGRDGGSSFIDALNVLSEQGAVSLADMPYSDRNFTNSPPGHLAPKARRYRIDYWRQVNIRDLKEVKAQLNAGYPVLIGAMIDEGFVKAKAGHVWKKSVGQTLGGHAMVLVGYDDARQAVKLINSWGANWGDKGFGWVDYKFFPQVVREGYVAKDAINGAGPPPQTPPSNTPSNRPTALPTAEPEYEPYDPEQEPEFEPQQEPEEPADPSLTDDPEPAAEQAEFSIENVEHNLKAPAPQYEKYGKFMKLMGGVRVPAGAGQKMQIVVRFYFDDGQGGKGKAVTSRIPEIFSIPDEGIAVAGTPQIALPAQGISNQWYAFAPYSAFNLPPGKVDLVAEPMLYVDSFGIRTGELIHFWVDTPAPAPSKQQPAASQAPAQAAFNFFKAMYDEDYATAWRLLSNQSKQVIVQALSEETELSSAEVMQMFNQQDELLLEHFWPTMRESMEIESWVSQSYSVQKVQGSQAQVMVSPVGQTLLMKLEGGHWKLGYAESFMDE